MSEESQLQGKRRVILMDPYCVDLYLLWQRERSLRRLKEGNMSKKEKKEAINVLLDLIRKHEGEWNANRTVAVLSVEQGLARDTVEGYIRELIAAQKVERRGEHLYIVLYSEKEVVKA